VHQHRSDRFRLGIGFWVAVILLVTPVSQASARVLKIATLSPDGTVWMRKMRAGATEISKRTQGRVTFKFYPGGVMGNDKSVLRKIRIGQLQGGAVTGGSLAEINPDNRIYGLPFLFHSLGEVDYVRARMDDMLIQGMEKHGFVTFGLAEGGFSYLMSNRPISTIQDLKGQKVWVPEGDTISRIVFETTGVSPISLSLADVMTGLQTGLIDTVANSPIGAIALQWHTKVKYLTDTPLTYYYGMLAVDRRVFMKIRPSDRHIVREVMQGIFQELNRQNRLDNENAKQALRSQGIAFVKPPPDALARWREIAATVRKRLGADGVFKPATLKILQGHLETYRKAQATASAK